MSFKWKSIDICFVLASIINIAVSLYFHTTLLAYLLFLIVTICLFSNKINKDTFILYILFIPNKYLQLIAIPIYLLKSKALMKKTLKNSEILFLIYIAVTSVVNCILYKGLVLGTFFQVGVYFCILKLIASYRQYDNFSFVISTLDKMFFLQIVTCAIDYLYFRAIDDAIMGTLISAHYLGIFLLIYMFLLIKTRPPQIKKVGYVFRYGTIALLLLISDAKHVWAIFLFAWTVSIIFKLFKIKNKTMVFVVAMTVFVVVGTLWLTVMKGGESLKNISIVSTYVLNGNYNKKITIFSNTFNKMLSANGLFGFGVGQFGSQVSLTLSKGIIYSWNPDLSAYQFAITPYAETVQGLMSEWYTKHGIGISSMVLGYPLVSFVGLFAELGVIGYIWLLRILDKRFKQSDTVFVLAFFMLTLFDTYFEIPCVLVLILIATLANNVETKNKLKLIWRGRENDSEENTLLLVR